MAMRNWEVTSHRGRIDGEQNGVPGNCLLAFQQAAMLPGIAGIETDVRLTKGGLLVVAHDNWLPNFSNGVGWTNSIMTRKELQALRVKCNGVVTEHGVPELIDVLDLLSRHDVLLHLELKYGPGDPSGLFQAVQQVLARYPRQRVVFSSFNHAEIPLTRPIGVLSNTLPVPNVLEYLKQFAVGERRLEEVAFHPDVWNLTDEAIQQLHTAGVTINAYTVPPALFQWALQNGVNIITDHPAAALEFKQQQAATGK